VNINLGLKQEPPVVEEVEEHYNIFGKFKIVLKDGKPKIIPISQYCIPTNKPRKPKKEKRSVVVSSKPMEISEGEF